MFHQAATAQFTAPQWSSLAYTRHDVRRVGCLHDIVTLACRAREIHKSESFKMYGSICESRIDVRCFIRRRPHNSQPRNGRALHTLDTMLDELGVYTILLHLHVELGKSTRAATAQFTAPQWSSLAYTRHDVRRVGCLHDIVTLACRAREIHKSESFKMYGSICESRIDVRCFIRRRPHNSQPRNGRALHTLDTMLDELGVYTILLHLHVELGKSTRAATTQFTAAQWPSLAYTRHDVRRVGCLHDIVIFACRAREIHKSESFKMYGSICESRIDVRCFIRRRPHNSQSRNGRALHTLDTMLDELGVYTILLHLHVELGKSTRSRIDVRCFIRRRPHNSQSRNGRALHTLDTMLDELGVYTILLHLHVELGKSTRSRIDVRCFIRRRPHNSQPRNGRALHTLDTMLDELGVYTILLHLHVELGKSTRSRIDVRCFIRRRPHNSQPRNGRALHTLDTMLDELGVYTILLHLHVELGNPKSESFKMYGSICESRIDVRCFIRRRPHNSQPRNGRALHTLKKTVHKLDCLHDTDFESELYIAQVLIPSVTVALFISTIDLVLNQLALPLILFDRILAQASDPYGLKGNQLFLFKKPYVK
ncbi:hypothetical protein J6590_059512 [Homalodisca vitripennis]|nr:hypothetical protein J6590_059512 [Homalodisca vitripennis]